jgi:transketolase
MTRNKINNIKIKMLKVANLAQEAHIGSSFSVLDILFILYNNILNVSPDKINDNDRDYMILSKGHAALAHAAILEEKNFITEKQFMTYCSYDSILGGHMDRNKVPGLEASTGSLGHGISISIGIAMASKIKGISNKVFTIVGDGESNEGTFWESMLLGSNHNLDNLCCIIDYNRSNDRALKLDSLEDKLKAFGWSVSVVNGHDHNELIKTLSSFEVGKPKAVIANTIKGFGVKEMENNHAWHHRSPSNKELENMISELS